MDENKVTGTPNPDYIPPAQPVDEPPVIVPQQVYVQQAIAAQQAQMQQAQVQQNQPTAPIAPAQPIQPQETVAPQEVQSSVDAADAPSEPVQADAQPTAPQTPAQQAAVPTVATPPVQNPYTVNNVYNPYVPPTPPKNQNQDMANGMAIAALICGAVGLVTSCCCMGGVPAILGVVFGIIALVNRTDKKPLAIVGLCLGAAAVLMSVVIWIYSFFIGGGTMFEDFYDEFYNDYYYEYEYEFPYEEDPYDYYYEDFM